MKKQTHKKQLIKKVLSTCGHILILTIVFSFLNNNAILAQDITENNLRWPCTKILEVSGGNLGNGQTNFTVFKNEKIEWRDAGGKLIYLFTIRDTKGTWADYSKPGEITYRIAYENTNGGMVSIKREGESVKIHVMIADGQRPKLYDLSSSNPEKIK